ncbi:hypothetical protein AM596_15090 [Clostridium perfringens CP4]|uniref:hypothetical protein n=1 Tax=Clostridium perfringens TaxID=1502 RepID=UPI0007082DCA|nr:hypothetical protein [Clostridium perfringens]KQC91356.1 hypothetical protein AM596_15090 [Clostridium perfringens CP4]
MDNKEINTKDLLGIDLGFENCEGMFIPVEALDNLYIKDGEINTYIYLNEKIEYKGFYDDLTPLQRIKHMNDITSVNLIYKDKDIEYQTVWYNAWEQENRYQTSELISWNKLHLEISKNVLRKEIQSMKDQATQLLEQIKELELSID